MGTRGDDAHFTASRTLDGFAAEVRAAGLIRAVVVGRDTPAPRIPNDTIGGRGGGRAVR